MKPNTKFLISEKPMSGCKWIEKQFADIVRTGRKLPKFLSFDVFKLFVKSLQQEIGKDKAFWLLIRASTLGYIFNNPKWQPELFHFSSKKQEKIYKRIYNEGKFFFIIFNILKKKFGEKESDKIIANTINPATLAYMKNVYKPIKNPHGIREWWDLSRDYIADLPAENLGLDGKVYIAEDMSEIKWHATRCVLADVFRAYGLKLTVAHMCMGDHITTHTFFPGIMFKRTSCMGAGDTFCDHHIWAKTVNDFGNEEIQYGDCNHFKGGREYVKKWEEFAKSYWFGNIANWENYAETIWKKILTLM